MKTFLFLLITVLLAGCDQTGLGAWNAMKNLVTSPIDKVREDIAEMNYHEGRDRTKKAHDEEAKLQEQKDKDCDPSGVHIEGKKDIEGIIGKAKPTCACAAWGDCAKATCSCEKLCPNTYDIFKHPAGQTLKELARPENNLAFRNTFGGSRHEATNGYCWGHANVTSQFNRLAFFDQSKKPPYDLDSKDPKVQQKAIAYYKDLINKITKNQATDVPGFKNLQEFSSHPALQSYIADKVAENWADKAMSWQGIGLTLSSEPAEGWDNREVFREIQERLDMHIQPAILFNDRGSSTAAHIVTVAYYERLQNGETKLCINDNNEDPKKNENCENFMMINTNGVIYYSAWKDGTAGEGDLGGFELAHDTNANVVAQSNSLVKKCKRDKDCK